MSFENESSMHSWVRLIGILYLAIIVIGALDQLALRGSLIVPGDPVQTARSILDAQWLWRLGIAGDIVMHLLDVPIMLVLYLLFRAVNPRLALLALLFNVVQTAVLVTNKQNLVQVLLLLISSDPASADFHQAAAQAQLLIDLHNYGFSIGLIFFGFSCCLYGYLIYRSGFLPRVLGVLMGIAGASYLVSSFGLLVAPGIAGALIPVLVLSLLGELSFALWLIFKGVGGQWREGKQASLVHTGSYRKEDMET